MEAADKYTYRVAWSERDGEYVATVAEFPSLSWLAPSQNAALDGLVAVVAEVLIDMRTNGEEIPAPYGTRRYSGKFQVRIPPETHRRISMEAAEEGISLNRLVASRL